jgi:Tfp pilus assembly PilM family ATPase
MIQRKRASSPIGLDIGQRTLAAAQLAPTHRGWRLQAAAILDRRADAPPVLEPREAFRIAQVLQRQGFTGRDVVAAVPEQRLAASMLELPPRSSGAPLSQLARMEMSRAHRLNAADFEMACWDVPGPARAAEGTHMMAVACRHNDADELIDGIESAGLRLLALDVRSWAIARACRPVLENDGSVAAILDLTDSAAILTIVNRSAPAYERLLTEGSLQHLRTTIRERLGIDAELADHIFGGLRLDPDGSDRGPGAGDAAAILAEHLDNLAAELRTALTYAEHRFDADIPRVHIQGAGAAISGIEPRLTSLLGTSARALRPADVLEISAPAAPAAAGSSALLVAIGLAMHGGGAH